MSFTTASGKAVTFKSKPRAKKEVVATPVEPEPAAPVADLLDLNLGGEDDDFGAFETAGASTTSATADDGFAAFQEVLMCAGMPTRAARRATVGARAEPPRVERRRPTTAGCGGAASEASRAAPRR